MAYIGNIPAEQFTSVDIQNFSVSATANYTLDRPVANENEIELFINNVRQHPGSGKAYTASGTALTLSEATAGTDTMYCVYQGKARQTVTPATSSVTNDMLAGSIADAKISAMAASKLTGTVAQANIADEAINEAKLQISNAPTNGYMLTAQSGNTGGLTWAEAGSGAMTRVGGAETTSQTTYADFDNVFTSTYRQYLITVACQFVSNDVHLKLRMRASGSVDSGSGEYSWIVGGRGVSGTSESGIGNGQGNSSDDSYQVNQWGASDNNTENIFFQIHVRNPLPSTTSNAEGNYVMFQNTATVWTSDNYMTIQHGGGRKSGATDNDGIRLYTSSGDFRTYKIDIYGLQAS